jgi:hypothetical protein
VTHEGREIGTDRAVAVDPHLAGEPPSAPRKDAEDADHLIDHQKRPSRREN